MKKKSVILMVFIMMIMVIGSQNAWCNDDDIKIRERELEKLREQIEKMDQTIAENKSLQSQTVIYIKETNTRIKNLESEIVTLNSNIEETLKAIEVKETRISEIEDEIDDKNLILNSRLRVMYKNGGIGYFEVLLGAEDFIDLISRADMLQKILRQDQDMIESMKALKDTIRIEKIELEAQKEIYEEQISSKEVIQVKWAGELSALEQYKEKLQADESTLASLEKELSNEADQLSTIIKKLNATETYVGGEMTWPIPGYYTISTSFGNTQHPVSKELIMHTGIDITCPKNTTVVAAQSGTVIYANWFGSYGKVVILDHGGGYTTLYGYNDILAVKIGDSVEKGDLISKSGSSGGTINASLHFEVRVNGDYQDPLKYVNDQ